jgi:hypothetical protein
VVGCRWSVVGGRWSVVGASDNGQPTTDNRQSVSDGDAALGGVGVLTVEDNDVADAHDNGAGGALGQEGCQGLFLLFEIEEFDLDEFVLGQGGVGALNEGIAQSRFADAQDWFESLGKSFELAELRSG